MIFQNNSIFYIVVLLVADFLSLPVTIAFRPSGGPFVFRQQRLLKKLCKTCKNVESRPQRSKLSDICGKHRDEK